MNPTPRRFETYERNEVKKYCRGKGSYQDNPYKMDRGKIYLKQSPDNFTNEPLGRLLSGFIRYSNSKHHAVIEEQKNLDRRVHELLQQLHMPRSA